MVPAPIVATRCSVSRLIPELPNICRQVGNEMEKPATHEPEKHAPSPATAADVTKGSQFISAAVAERPANASVLVTREAKPTVAAGVSTAIDTLPSVSLTSFVISPRPRGRYFHSITAAEKAERSRHISICQAKIFMRSINSAIGITGRSQCGRLSSDAAS